MITSGEIPLVFLEFCTENQTTDVLFLNGSLVVRATFSGGEKLGLASGDFYAVCTLSEVEFLSRGSKLPRVVVCELLSERRLILVVESLVR